MRFEDKRNINQTDEIEKTTNVNSPNIKKRTNKEKKKIILNKSTKDLQLVQIDYYVREKELKDFLSDKLKSLSNIKDSPKKNSGCKEKEVMVTNLKETDNLKKKVVSNIIDDQKNRINASFKKSSSNENNNKINSVKFNSLIDIQKKSTYDNVNSRELNINQDENYSNDVISKGYENKENITNFMGKLKIKNSLSNRELKIIQLDLLEDKSFLNDNKNKEMENPNKNNSFEIQKSLYNKKYLNFEDSLMQIDEVLNKNLFDQKKGKFIKDIKGNVSFLVIELNFIFINN